ncbi:MAG TPA: hypothetical protein VN688_32960 [Gemmataceae bacterium]|nr:hypothetical protein [Gemmataceae bacterium]
MKYLSHLLLFAVVSTIATVGLSTIFACGEQSEGRSLAQWLFFEMRRNEALQERATEVSQSMEVKKAIIADLLADQITLREATQQFRAVNEMVEKAGDSMLATYRLPQTDEEVGQQVIAWAKAELVAHPRPTKRTLQQLEKDLLSSPYSSDPIQ